MLLSAFAVELFYFQQKTAYDMRISDWGSDVCASDLDAGEPRLRLCARHAARPCAGRGHGGGCLFRRLPSSQHLPPPVRRRRVFSRLCSDVQPAAARRGRRSEEHPSELQSLMRISYAVFFFKKKKNNEQPKTHT